MNNIPFSTISIDGALVERLKTAPREVLENLAVLTCSALSGLSTGVIPKMPPPATLEVVMTAFFSFAERSTLLPAAEADAAMREAEQFEQPEPTVSDVSQAADLLKKFSLH